MRIPGSREIVPMPMVARTLGVILAAPAPPDLDLLLCV